LCDTSLDAEEGGIEISVHFFIRP